MHERRDVRSFGNEMSLKALGAAVSVLLQNEVTVKEVPVENLIAKEIGIEDWESESAEREVKIYLLRASGPLLSAFNFDYISNRTPLDDDAAAEALGAAVENGGLAGS